MMRETGTSPIRIDYWERFTSLNTAEAFLAENDGLQIPTIHRQKSRLWIYARRCRIVAKKGNNAGP